MFINWMTLMSGNDSYGDIDDIGGSINTLSFHDFYHLCNDDSILLRSQLNAKLFFRFPKLPAKTTEISHLLEEKIEKFGV